MKLLKKLLPIAGVAGVTAVITPLVTSCGIGSKTFDGTDIYVPKSDQAVSKEACDDKAATELYHKDLKEHKDIFKEDMYCWFSYLLVMLKAEAQLDYMVISPKIKLNYTNLKVGDVKTSTDGIKYFLLSFNMSGAADLDLSFDISNHTSVNPGIQSMDLIKLKSFNVKLENVPYRVSGSYDYEWSLANATSTFISEDMATDWKVTFKANGHMLGDDGRLCVLDNKEVTIDKDHSPRDLTEDQQTFLYVAQYLTSVQSSYHMANIKYNAE